ncbi:hypothetical protein ACQU0X_26760 [Pseudovibrio ascidiaceicola]|uniref:hypothetical protein n=1 Tax=Pseudovibrio ascidiaceicola TaxID=285279 RepID=UPI003D35B784
MSGPDFAILLDADQPKPRLAGIVNVDATGDYDFDLSVTDSEGRTITSRGNISVTDLMEITEPEFLPASVNVPLFEMVPPAVSIQPGSYTWGMVVPNDTANACLASDLSIDPQNGRVSGAPYQKGDCHLQISVSNSAGYTVYREVNFAVKDPVVINKTVAADSAFAGKEIVYSPGFASGGDGVYTYTASGLPAGITLETIPGVGGTPASFRLVGIAPAAGSYPYVIEARDDEQRVANRDMILEVSVGSLVEITPPSYKELMAGKEIYVPAPLVQGIDSDSLRFIADGLPAASVKLDQLTGVISGRYYGVIDYNITIRAYDVNDPSVSGEYTLSGTFLDTLTLKDNTGRFQNNDTIAFAITDLKELVEGGAAPYTFEVTSQYSRGLGLTLDSNGNLGSIVADSPAAQMHKLLDVKVTDAHGYVATAAIMGAGYADFDNIGVGGSLFLGMGFDPTREVPDHTNTYISVTYDGSYSSGYPDGFSNDKIYTFSQNASSSQINEWLRFKQNNDLHSRAGFGFEIDADNLPRNLKSITFCARPGTVQTSSSFSGTEMWYSMSADDLNIGRFGGGVRVTNKSDNIYHLFYRLNFYGNGWDGVRLETTTSYQRNCK